MASPASILDAAIRAMAPIHGVRIGTADNKSTWAVDFSEDATDDQKAKVSEYINDFDRMMFIRSSLTESMDRLAEDIRMRHLTPGNGMTLTYIEKLSEARGASDLDDNLIKSWNATESEYKFPVLSASVDVEAGSLLDVVKLILSRHSYLSNLFMNVERVRLMGRRDVISASTPDEAKEIFRKLVWPK